MPHRKARPPASADNLSQPNGARESLRLGRPASFASAFPAARAREEHRADPDRGTQHEGTVSLIPALRRATQPIGGAQATAPMAKAVAASLEARRAKHRGPRALLAAVHNSTGDPSNAA